MAPALCESGAPYSLQLNTRRRSPRAPSGFAFGKIPRNARRVAAQRKERQTKIASLPSHLPFLPVRSPLKSYIFKVVGARHPRRGVFIDWAVPFTTLTLMEIVLGIDNIIFLSILVGTLPPHRQAFGRILGLGLALAARMLLLFGIRFVMGLSNALFHLSSIDFLPDAWLRDHHVDAVTGQIILVGEGSFSSRKVSSRSTRNSKVARRTALPNRLAGHLSRASSRKSSSSISSSLSTR